MCGVWVCGVYVRCVLVCVRCGVHVLWMWSCVYVQNGPLTQHTHTKPNTYNIKRRQRQRREERSEKRRCVVRVVYVAVASVCTSTCFHVFFACDGGGAVDHFCFSLFQTLVHILSNVNLWKSV